MAATDIVMLKLFHISYNTDNRTGVICYQKIISHNISYPHEDTGIKK